MITKVEWGVLWPGRKEPIWYPSQRDAQGAIDYAYVLDAREGQLVHRRVDCHPYEVGDLEEWADVRRGDFDRWLRQVKAAAIREYVAAARENPHTYHWPPVGVLDDAEQWADEIEKGAI